METETKNTVDDSSSHMLIAHMLQLLHHSSKTFIKTKNRQTHMAIPKKMLQIKSNRENTIYYKQVALSKCSRKILSQLHARDNGGDGIWRVALLEVGSWKGKNSMYGCVCVCAYLF